MIKFSHLQEILTKSQKKEVDTWEKGDNSFSNHLFDHPEHTEKTIPLEHPDAAGHEDDIRGHLEPHGIKIKDYKSGIGEDKHGREVKLGKALEKTKASDELKNKFANDPSRSNKEQTSSDLRVTISRHPHHVAGMTSSGHCWEEESCMKFGTGSRSYHLPGEVKHGTHVAYLHHKDDHELEHPLARIALKKFTDNDSGHAVLRPENRTYGPENSAFEHTVHKFINDKMPVHDSGLYRKHEEVYDDSGKNTIIGKSKKALHDAIKEKIDPNSKLSISDHAITHHPEFGDRENETLMKSGNFFGLSSPNLSKEHITKHVEDTKDNPNKVHHLLNNPKISSEHVDKLIENQKDLSPLDKPLGLKPEHLKTLISKTGNWAWTEHPNSNVDVVKHSLSHAKNGVFSLRDARLRGNQLHSLAKHISDSNIHNKSLMGAEIIHHPRVKPETVKALAEHPSMTEIGKHIQASNMKSQDPDVLRHAYHINQNHYKNEPESSTIHYFTKVGWLKKPNLPEDVVHDIHDFGTRNSSSRGLVGEAEKHPNFKFGRAAKAND